MSWVMRYLGRPWVAGETDCWNFARLVWREHFGRIVPAVDVDVASPFAARRALRAAPTGPWAQTDSPLEGDAVLMSTGTMPCHVGIHMASGAVLHSVEGAGVICTPPGGVLRIGYQICGIYRWQE